MSYASVAQYGDLGIINIGQYIIINSSITSLPLTNTLASSQLIQSITIPNGVYSITLQFTLSASVGTISYPYTIEALEIREPNNQAISNNTYLFNSPVIKGSLINFSQVFPISTIQYGNTINFYITGQYTSGAVINIQNTNCRILRVG